MDARRLVFIDESGANVAMGRSHAWTLKGQVLVDPRPMNWGNNLTMIGAIRTEGWLTLGTMFKPANRERFLVEVRTSSDRHPWWRRPTGRDVRSCQDA